MRYSWILLAASAMSFAGALLGVQDGVEFAVTVLLIAGVMRRVEYIELRGDK